LPVGTQTFKGPRGAFPPASLGLLLACEIA
jgi:hypothetical protein